MERRLVALCLLVLAVANMGCGRPEDPVGAPPPQSQAEQMKDKGYSQEEIDSRMSQPK